MGNWHSALLTLDSLTKVGRKRIPAWALVHDKPMYCGWNLVATPAVPLAVVLEDRSLSSGSGQDSAATGSSSGKAMPHAVTHTVGFGFIGKNMCCFPSWCTSSQLMSWKIFFNFLKYFLDYCMGYGKTVDVSRYVHGKSNREQLGTQQTNLTRRKKMGFDLYSLGNHKTETGEYYRQSVWGWRRLADFVCEQTGVIAEDNKQYWQSNDGHEVSEGEAKEIAKQLKALIKDGTVSKAIREVEEESEQAERNNKFVEICHKMLREKVERETGKTNTAPADYPKEDHDTWEWIQRKYSYGSSYPFTMEQVESFIKFCEQSNGFRIC